MSSESRLNRALLEVEDELRAAMDRYPAMQSAHEGYAVLLEEADELWTEVKRHAPHKPNFHRMHEEAVQVAAMSVRFLIDVTLPALAAEDA